MVTYKVKVSRKTHVRIDKIKILIKENGICGLQIDDSFLNPDNSKKRAELMESIGRATAHEKSIRNEIYTLENEKKQYENLKSSIEQVIKELNSAKSTDASAKSQINRSLSGVRQALISGEIESIITEIGECISSLQGVTSSIADKIADINKKIAIKEEQLRKVKAELDELWDNYALLD